MGRFVFSLQNVLDVKEKMEAQSKQEFATASAMLEEQKSILGNLIQRKEDILEEGKHLLENMLDFKKIDSNRLEGEYVDRKITEQQINVNKAEANLERARRKMSDAMAERKTYDKLRDKALEEFLAEENRAEGKSVDELTSYIYGRKTST